MKNKFPGYFKPTTQEIKKLWDKALFTLDANVLLNLYRYSDETRDEFIKILEKIKGRVWIPNHAAREFFQRRLDVIDDQEKAYENAINSIGEIEKGFKNSRRHPFIDEKLLKRYTKLSSEIIEELTNNQRIHGQRVHDDEIMDKIESVFSENVGEEYDDDAINKIIAEGEERFQKKIPPGYKDANKSDDSKDIRQYGDLIIWKQILDKSTSEKKGVILVTDDRKEDWWLRFKGKILQPRPELVKEFKVTTNQNFHMYQSDRFLEFAREYLNEEVNQNAIDEIKELRKLDENERRKHLKMRRHLFELSKVKDELHDKASKMQSELAYLKAKKDSIKKRHLEEDFTNEYKDGDEREDFRLKKIVDMLFELSQREEMLKSDLEKNNNQLQNIESELDFLKRRKYYL
ncbi:MAG: PIN-like domain-containing protein [Candidatus Paceibacterota bacterium]